MADRLKQYREQRDAAIRAAFSEKYGREPSVGELTKMQKIVGDNVDAELKSKGISNSDDIMAGTQAVLDDPQILDVAVRRSVIKYEADTTGAEQAKAEQSAAQAKSKQAADQARQQTLDATGDPAQADAAAAKAEGDTIESLSGAVQLATAADGLGFNPNQRNITAEDVESWNRDITDPEVPKFDPKNPKALQDYLTSKGSVSDFGASQSQIESWAAKRTGQMSGDQIAQQEGRYFTNRDGEKIFVPGVSVAALQQIDPKWDENFRRYASNGARSDITPYELAVISLQAAKNKGKTEKIDNPNRSGAIDYENRFGQLGIDPRDKYQAYLDVYKKKYSGEGYGGVGLAIIASEDRALADRIYANGGPTTPEEAQKVRQILLENRFDQNTMEALGKAWDPAEYKALTAIAANGRSGAGDAEFGGVVVNELPNKAALTEQANAMWRNILLDDAPNEIKNDLYSQLVGTVMRINQARANASNPFEGNYFRGGGVRTGGPKTINVETPNAEAMIQQKVKGSAQYKELYGKKAAGVTEENYQRGFMQTATELLGAEGMADNTAIKAGMAAGDTNVTGIAASVGASAQDNSTFLERWARTANIVDSLT